MTVEADLYTVLKGLVSNRCFPDVAPLNATRPYITYTQIGGEALTFIGNELPSKKHGRFQINVWADTRASASTVMLAVESAMTLATAFQAKPLGASSSDYDHDMTLYGSMQDFSVFSNR